MAKLPAFKERLNLLLIGTGKTIVAFAEGLGISRQSLGYYLNGDRIPDASILKQIAERCKVSTDWLLGISDVRKPNAELRGVSEFIGLSDNATMSLKYGLLNKKMLDTILSNESTLKIFSDMLNEITAASLKPSFVYDDKNAVVGILENRFEYHAILAGRSAEKIAHEVRKMEVNQDGKP